ncbi:MAG: hypothetical protein HKN00_09550 [Flavobacteriaceae bacterium]|nr:hypothetical protein [Bacteroidia bacterium]NNF75417.1 hypothetical protein [Flavobacteriaceae bacterium]NNK72251.1 hypothetical protein [Flavobacteriaceae bacterium]
MKNLFFFTFSIIFFLSATAQSDLNTVQKTDDEYVLNKPSNQSYRYVQFPRPNFVIKRGGIANYRALVGVKLRIHSVDESKELVYLTRSDGKKFFNKYKLVSADLNKAVNSGELSKVKP